MGIPKLKKKVSDFFTSEEGAISKDKLLKTGIVIAGIAVSAGTTFADHSNTYDDCNGVPGSGGDGVIYHSNSISLSKDLLTSKIDGAHCNGQKHSSHVSHSSGGMVF